MDDKVAAALEQSSQAILDISAMYFHICRTADFVASEAIAKELARQAAMAVHFHRSLQGKPRIPEYQFPGFVKGEQN
jgi:hypothetical protein